MFKKRCRRAGAADERCSRHRASATRSTRSPARTRRTSTSSARGIEPLAATGKLGAAARAVSGELQGQPGVARLPRRSCFARSPATGRRRAAAPELERSHRRDAGARWTRFGAAWVQIDEPKFRFSIRQNYLPNVKGFYYMRLHGRNAANWWRHDKSEDRYDYLYSADELREFSDTADAARRLVKKLYLYTNNHFSAKSVANAVMIKKQLGEPIDGEYSPEFFRNFPKSMAWSTCAPLPTADEFSGPHAHSLSGFDRTGHADCRTRRTSIAAADLPPTAEAWK